MSAKKKSRNLHPAILFAGRAEYRDYLARSEGLFPSKPPKLAKRRRRASGEDPLIEELIGWLRTLATAEEVRSLHTRVFRVRAQASAKVGPGTLALAETEVATWLREYGPAQRTKKCIEALFRHIAAGTGDRRWSAVPPSDALSAAMKKAAPASKGGKGRVGPRGVLAEALVCFFGFGSTREAKKAIEHALT